jgi:hypothetical protein
MILGYTEDLLMNAAAIASISIDLGKTIFHLVALDCHGKVIVRKKFSRSQLLACTASLPWSLIGMEACSGAHFILTFALGLWLGFTAQKAETRYPIHGHRRAQARTAVYHK